MQADGLLVISGALEDERDSPVELVEGAVDKPRRRARA